jgi:anti-sigma B factor antagonist
LSDLALDQIDSSISMISLRGEHDMNDAADLRDAIGKLQQEGAGIVLDLSETTFIDSSILTALVEAQRTARAAGLGLVVYTGNGLDQGVHRILDLTGMAGEMPLHADRNAAIAAVREGLA